MKLVIRRIYKENLYNRYRGDVEYIEDPELPDVITLCNFFLADVAYWEEYITTESYFKNDEKKTVIVFRTDIPTIIILMPFEDFDKVMEGFIIKMNQERFIKWNN